MNPQAMPFNDSKIPVCAGLVAFKDFAEKYPGFSFCPYVADKDPEQWDVSTSRVYMNQVLPGFLYVPVNIPKGDKEQLTSFFEFVSGLKNVPAVNITQPHKSSPVIRLMFLGDESTEENVDTLIRNKEGRLIPYDLNAPAFVEWFIDEVGKFEGREVVLIGVGGVGEPMAKHIADQQPSRLVLVDPVDKSSLAEMLKDKVPATYTSSLSTIANLAQGSIVINAAGKEGATDGTQLQALLERFATPDNIFVDIRPHLEIEVVEKAKLLGWQAFTGHGMNARNDFVLLTGIAKNLGVEAPSFEAFQKLVARAS